MEKKRSSSLQNYLDNLDKQSFSSDEDEWGFFVDMEHKSKNTNATTTMQKKININHYHYHNYHNNDDKKYNKDAEDTTLACGGNILIFLVIVAYLFLM